MLLGSEMVLRVGLSLYTAVLPWLLLDITGSNSSVGWATAATFLPYLVAAMPAGMLVDRLERRSLMLLVTLTGALLADAIRF